jgi:hypothetical protein
MSVRRPYEHHPCLSGKNPVVAEKPPTQQEPVVLEALLGAGGAEAGRRWVELDLQGAALMGAG